MSEDYTTLSGVTTVIPANNEEKKGLAERVLSGEIIIMRDCANRAGLIEEIRAASLEGIGRVAGREAADLIEREGFEKTHLWVEAEQIPMLTDRVYEIVARKAAGWLKRLVPEVFGERTPFYFEREPNVRFLLPYGLSQAHRAAFRQFSKAHGEGKITAHGPHRDSWLDCPDNAINIWIAVGPVQRGNGMSFYPESYRAHVRHTESGSIAHDENPGQPINFELAPGDAIIFHGDQLHASELNRTDETRHVLSFRLTLDKPRFPNGHYHHYLYSSLAEGWGAPFAGLPANLAWSYLATRLKWVRQVLATMLPNTRSVGEQSEQQRNSFHNASGTTRRMDISDLEVGSLRPISSKVCLARINRERTVAFARKCPHEGADLSLGTVHDGQLICPWHNLHFDLHDGKSHCSGLADLRMYKLSERDGTVTLED